MSATITEAREGVPPKPQISEVLLRYALSDPDGLLEEVKDAVLGTGAFEDMERHERAAFARDGLEAIFLVRPGLRGSDWHWRYLEYEVKRLSRPGLSRRIAGCWRAFRETPAGRAAGWLFVPLVFILTKLKAVLFVASKLKFFMPVASMAASIGAYALFWGIPFAAGFVALLFVHEMGHAIQLRREGIKASAPVFIPFVGALISMREMPRDAAMEARVGLAGPALGTAAALVPLALYPATGNPLFQALAYVGFFLNLFNLIPLTPLDGGRAMAAVSPWAWPVGLALLVASMFVIGFSPLVVLIVLIGGAEAYRRFRNRHAERGYYRVAPRQRIAVAAVYLSLLTVTAIGTQLTYIERLPG